MITSVQSKQGGEGTKEGTSCHVSRFLFLTTHLCRNVECRLPQSVSSAQNHFYLYFTTVSTATFFARYPKAVGTFQLSTYLWPQIRHQGTFHLPFTFTSAPPLPTGYLSLLLQNTYHKPCHRITHNARRLPFHLLFALAPLQLVKSEQWLNPS